MDRRGDFDVLVIKYLQAININEHINPGANALLGSLWRNLYWLSKDIEDTDFALYCGKKAIEKFRVAIDGNEFVDITSKATIALSLANIIAYCKETKDIKHYIHENIMYKVVQN